MLYLSAGLVLVLPCAAAPFEFEETGSLATGRSQHAATLLRNAARCSSHAVVAFSRSAELYDPATGTWRVTDSLATARDDQTATLLPDGKVLVAAGSTSRTATASAELFQRAEAGQPPAASPPNADQ
jgi:hypothetical protein